MTILDDDMKIFSLNSKRYFLLFILKCSQSTKYNNCKIASIRILRLGKDRFSSEGGDDPISHKKIIFRKVVQLNMEVSKFNVYAPTPPGL